MQGGWTPIVTSIAAPRLATAAPHTPAALGVLATLATYTTPYTPYTPSLHVLALHTVGSMLPQVGVHVQEGVLDITCRVLLKGVGGGGVGEAARGVLDVVMGLAVERCCRLEHDGQVCVSAGVGVGI